MNMPARLESLPDGTEIDVAHVILFGEYMYGDFGSRQFTITDTSGFTPLNYRHDASIEAHLFPGGEVWR